MVAQALPSRSQCSYNVRETPREMCTTVDMVSFQVDILDTLDTLDALDTLDTIDTPVDTLDIYIIHLLQEVCEEVPRMVPEVTCDTRMKEIELKEICVDIDLQLPRSGAGDVSTISRASTQGGVQHGGEGAVQVRAPGGDPPEVRPHRQGGVPGQDEASLH